MSIATTIDHPHRLVLTHMNGSITDAEITEHERSLAKQPGFQADYAQLVDASDATLERVSSQCLRMIAALTPFTPTAKRAYVVNGQIGRMLAIIFGVHSSLNEQYFFVTDQLDTAYDWLQRENLVIPPSNNHKTGSHR